MATSHLRGSFPSSPHLHDLGCSSEQPPPWQEATELLPCLDSQCASHCRADPAVCVCTCTWLVITPECLPQLPLENVGHLGTAAIVTDSVHYGSGSQWPGNQPDGAEVPDHRHVGHILGLFLLHALQYCAPLQPQARGFSATETRTVWHCAS